MTARNGTATRRVVLITGVTRGIGFAAAKEFLKNDDTVVIFCRHEDHRSRQGEIRFFDRSVLVRSPYLSCRGDFKVNSKIVFAAIREVVAPLW